MNVLVVMPVVFAVNCEFVPVGSNDVVLASMLMADGAAIVTVGEVVYPEPA